MLLLPREKFFLLKEKIKEVRMNNLFARSVIEQHVTGKIYVDNTDNPKTVYVVHPYGMSLLFGDYSNRDFNSQFKSYILGGDSGLHTSEWLQTFPREWDEVIQNLFGNMIVKPSVNTNQPAGQIELHTRVNFNFNKEKYLQRRKAIVSDSDRIVETDSSHFEQMPGSVIPMKFWDSAADFIARGKGFTLLHHGEIASTAYSAYVHENMLEMGIETVEKFRGMGYAGLTCSRLIDYCLDHNLVPVWSCRYENTASYLLAQKLGFEPTVMVPFYRINKH